MLKLDRWFDKDSGDEESLLLHPGSVLVHLRLSALEKPLVNGKLKFSAAWARRIRDLDHRRPSSFRNGSTPHGMPILMGFAYIFTSAQKDIRKNLYLQRLPATPVNGCLFCLSILRQSAKLVSSRDSATLLPINDREDWYIADALFFSHFLVFTQFLRLLGIQTAWRPVLMFLMKWAHQPIEGIRVVHL